MGKHGPCYHCGVTNTPLWRNGPPEKPVLCNACGSRWRTKGTLANYTPLHARAEPGDFEDYRGSKVKTTPIRIKEPKVLKRKHIYDYSEVGVPPDYSHVLSRGLDEDTSNRSSSGSAVSNSESCAQFGGTELSDLTGPAQPNNTWETMVPSKKRTCVGRPKPSPVEKLTKDLCTILHEQQSSYFSGSSEEDLLFESDKPMVSVEIGHGSILIRHPSSIGREEESEASSLSVDNKQNPGNEAYSPWPTPSVNIHSKGFNSSPSTGIESIKKPPGHGMNQELAKRDKDRLEKLHMLGHHNSPLCYIDLKDIINFDEFTSKLTTDEQQQLLKCLPSVDTSTPPDSFRGMFESAQFKENLSCFQKLLAEGVLDNSLSGVKVEDCRTLKRFAMYYLTKSKWVEQYNLLKDVKCKNAGGGFGVAGVRNDVGIGHSVNVKRSVDGQNQKISVAKTVMRSPKRVVSHGGYENKEENDGSCFSPKRLFALPLDTISPALESSDHDLLLDVPSNGSFPQAELLLPSRFDAQASTSTSSLFLNRVHP